MKLRFLPVVPAMVLLLTASCRKLPNDPPKKPKPPTGIAAAKADTVYEFTAATCDPDGDSVCMRVDWGNGDTSEWSNFTPSDSPVVFSHAWDSAGWFSIRTQARDVRGLNSEWSNPATVIVSGIHPLLWSRGSEDGDPCSPMVLTSGTDDLIYVGFCSDSVKALSGDGTVRYAATSVDPSYNGEFITMPVYCPQTGHIIMGNDEGELYAFTQNLELAWHWPGNCNGEMFDDREWGMPAVYGNRIYVMHEDADYMYGMVCCILDLGDEALLVGAYTLPGDDECFQPPVIDADGNVLVQSDNGILYKFSPDLDSMLLELYLGRQCTCYPPVIGGDGTIYWGSLDDWGLHALEPDGSEKWVADIDHPSLPVVGESLLFLGTEDGDVVAVRAKSGYVKWRLTAGGPRSEFLSSPLLCSNGTLYINDDYFLYCLNQTDGLLLWTTELPDWPARSGRGKEDESPASPSIAPNGDIIVPTYAWMSRVTGYPGTTLANAPWPKYQRDLFNTGCAAGPQP